MMISFAFNVFLAMITAGTAYASDKEWFRIRIYNFIIIFFQMIFGAIRLM